MAHPIMSGLGYSRFLVERFHPEPRALEGDAASRATDSAVKSMLSSDEISRRSTAEEEAEAEPETEAGEVREEEPNLEVGEGGEEDFGESMRLDETPRSTQQSYERIARIATHAAEQIDWRQLRNSTALWDEKKRVSASPNFSIYTRQSRGMHYVMAIGTVSCSVSELKTILRPATNAKYRAVMVELYGDAFLDGSIRYQPRPSVDNASNDNHHGQSRDASRSRTSVHTKVGRSSTSTTAPFGRPSYRPRHHETITSEAAFGSRHSSYMAKTATFAKSHVFAKAHQWSFLECFLENPGRHGFTVSMSSLGPFFGASESRGFYSRAKSWIGGPVEQLQGITAAYSVVPTTTSRRDGGSEVQVVFYSKFAEDSTTFGPFKRHTYKLALRSHLLQMARAATRLPIMVRRRRLEALSPSDNNRAFTLSNPLCICCTTTLHFLKAKSRCRACGYFVCDKCSIEQEVEVEPQAPIARARVCQPCIRRVDEAIYERASALDEFGNDLASEVPAEASSGPKSASMANALDRIFHTGPEEKRHAVMSVLKYVLDDNSVKQQHDQRDLRDQKQRQRRKKSPSRPRSSSLSSSLSSSVDSDSFANTEPHSEKDYLRVLQNHLTASHTAVAAVTGDTTGRHSRNYPAGGVCVYDDTDVGDFTGRCNNPSKSHQDARHLVPYRGHPTSVARKYPEPHNEAHRSKMAREQLAAIEDVSSLEIICSIASKELECPIAMITLVESDKTHVVASNSEQYRGVVVPRGESLCAYTVMAGNANRALVVRHPERDARFRDMVLAQQPQSLRFYCGFPVTSHDGSVVGALCCGDFAPGDREPSRFGRLAVGGERDDDAKVMTAQQTDAMTKLAATASKVMQLRGNSAYKRL